MAQAEVTAVSARRMAGFVGLLLVNFTAMFLIAGVGVYSYTVATFFGAMDSVSMIFALECVARSVSIPLGGKLGDKIGHKRLFIGAVVLYIAAYAVCSASTSFWMFTVARMVSGFAWGLFLMNGFVLISAIFGQERAPKYSGYNQSLTTVSMILGGPISGFVCAINWRLQFWVAIALLVVGLALCIHGIPDIEPREGDTSFDIPGVIFTAVTLVPFSLAMNWGNTMGWLSPLVLALLALTVVGLVGLVLSERRAGDPVFPYRLLSNKYYLVILLLMFVFSVLNGAGNYLPSFAQAVMGASSQLAGLVSVPGLLVAVFLTVYFGDQASRTGAYRPMVLVWAAVSVVASAALLLTPGMAAGTMGVVLLLVGATGLGAVNSVNQIAPYTYPMKVLSGSELASGLAFMGLAGALGSTISVGICGALLNSSGGFGAVFAMPVVCAVVMLVLALRFKDVK